MKHRNESNAMRVALCIECPLLQHGGVEVLVRALLSGLARSADVFLVSEDPLGGPPASPVATDLQGHFSWNPSNHSREQIDRLIDLRRDLDRERKQVMEQNDYFRVTGQLKEHNHDNRV